METETFPRRLLPQNWTPPLKGGALAGLGLKEHWPALLTQEQAAAYLNVSETWLEKSGIPRVELPTTGKSGRNMRRYRRVDLDAYAEAHLCRDPRIK
ncbi:MAG: helix-turn-helix domain-containing protein [Gemmatimonadota bacterium]|nr:helix-turn-helix domain-containing protein [Gemmatimonadota bacterium]